VGGGEGDALSIEAHRDVFKGIVMGGGEGDSGAGIVGRGNIEEMRKIAESRGGKCLSEHYVNVDTRLRWQCKKGHIWEAVPSSIKRGSWCARCVRRKQK